MSDYKQLIVFDIEIDRKSFPKLYEYGVQHKERLEQVFGLIKKYSSAKLEDKQLIELVERGEPVLVLEEKIGILEYPAIYCWYMENPKGFKKFFGEAVEKLWEGDTKKALAETEAYLEKDLK